MHPRDALLQNEKGKESVSVLIVDDEVEITQMIKKHLALEGIDTEAFNSSIEALKDHKKHLHPVVILDIRMPEMDGVTFIREVKRIHPTCIVFIITGYGSMDNLTECLELGAADYFTKPFKDLNFIVRSVQDALLRHTRWKLELIKIQRIKGTIE